MTRSDVFQIPPEEATGRRDWSGVDFRAQVDGVREEAFLVGLEVENLGVACVVGALEDGDWTALALLDTILDTIPSPP
jgi:hypothetical protein